MSTIDRCKGFCRYWRDLLKGSKEEHKMIVGIIIGVAACLGFLGYQYNFSPIISAISIAIAIGLGLRAFIWMPFRKHEELTAELANIKSEQIQFSVDFINPVNKDPHLLFWAFRVGITHNHPTKTVKRVRVLLINIDSEIWKTAGRPAELDDLPTPFPLPGARSEDTSQGHDIAPDPYRKEFDVLLVKSTLLGSSICVAPYVKPNASDGDFYEMETPTAPHRVPKSRNAEFKAVKLGGKEERFTITLQVTGEEAKTISATARLSITPYKFNPSPEASVTEDPPPPHWEPV